MPWKTGTTGGAVIGASGGRAKGERCTGEGGSLSAYAAASCASPDITRGPDITRDKGTSADGDIGLPPLTAEGCAEGCAGGGVGWRSGESTQLAAEGRAGLLTSTIGVPRARAPARKAPASATSDVDHAGAALAGPAPWRTAWSSSRWHGFSRLDVFAFQSAPYALTLSKTALPTALTQGLPRCTLKVPAQSHWPR